MTVYVDDFAIPYRGMLMHHMVADSDEELRAMARTIGVQLRWHQHPGTASSHFDIAQSKRALAIKAGATAISAKQLAAMVRCRKITGALGTPEGAIERRNALVADLRAKHAAGNA